MRLLLESWQNFLAEQKTVFYVDINSLLPTEELGHGKDHHCPGEECDALVQKKMHMISSGVFKPLEVCNQKPVNTYRIQDQDLAPKSGMREPFYYVLNGHHRLEAAKILGIQKIPVYLTNEEAR
jgi:hypothetical protein